METVHLVIPTFGAHALEPDGGNNSYLEVVFSPEVAKMAEHKMTVYVLIAFA